LICVRLMHVNSRQTTTEIAQQPGPGTDDMKLVLWEVRVVVASVVVVVDVVVA